MPLPPLDRFNVKDIDLQRIQEAVFRSLAAVLRVPILDGRLLTAPVGTTQTAVAHGLARAPLGWVLVSLSQQSIVWQTQAPDDKFLYLRASDAFSPKVWVF